MTQEQLARKLGCSTSLVVSIERGRRGITFSRVGQLRVLLHLTDEELASLTAAERADVLIARMIDTDVDGVLAEFNMPLTAREAAWLWRAFGSPNPELDPALRPHRGLPRPLPLRRQSLATLKTAYSQAERHPEYLYAQLQLPYWAARADPGRAAAELLLQVRAETSTPAIRRSAEMALCFLGHGQVKRGYLQRLHDSVEEFELNLGFRVLFAEDDGFSGNPGGSDPLDLPNYRTAAARCGERTLDYVLRLLRSDLTIFEINIATLVAWLERATSLRPLESLTARDTVGRALRLVDLYPERYDPVTVVYARSLRKALVR